MGTCGFCEINIDYKDGVSEELKKSLIDDLRDRPLIIVTNDYEFKICFENDGSLDSEMDNVRAVFKNHKIVKSSNGLTYIETEDNFFYDENEEGEK